MLNPNDQIHDLLLGQEGITHRKQIQSQQCVLDDTHDGGVVLWGDDLLRDVGNVLKFRYCFVGLGNVHVHFVTVEISVVGCAHG